ncbi:integrating conjugative element protein [Pseudomonas asplenii]|uniref:integrating conjugative element protein n=1 Tax=Pseudomonas asplenii TaxID=53407 RepID=UPI000477C6A9|nr:integrating conjugative element protein [Pseudomonas fuscovaginae]
MKSLSLSSAAALFLCHAAMAELTVVQDLGGTSALAYYRSLNLPLKDAPTGAISVAPRRVKPYSEADMLPVRSPSMSPGRVAPRAHSLPGLQTIFLVGDDPLSRQWLRERVEVLRDLKAMGLVINVQRPQALTELRQLGEGLQMAPVAADDLAHRLAITHYPVLVTATGLEQ